MSTYHTQAPLENSESARPHPIRHWRPGELIKNCLRCGCYFIRTGRAFTVRCAEGRTVVFSICRACAAATAFAAAISYPEVQAA